MVKFKLGIAIGLCVLATIFAIFSILKSSKNEIIIKLDSNPSTGYVWEYSVSSADIIEISKSYKTDCAPNLVGCGGQDVYTIKPLKEGKVTINYVYRKAMEEDLNSLKAVYEIEIDNSLKMIESHSGSYFEKDK